MGLGFVLKQPFPPLKNLPYKCLWSNDLGAHLVEVDVRVLRDHSF